MQTVFRHVGRKTAVIKEPTIYEILDDNFDYGKYSDEQFKKNYELREKYYQINLQEEFTQNLHDRKTAIISDEQTEINFTYDDSIGQLQKKYEEAYSKGCAGAVNEEITKTMKELTIKYLEESEKSNGKSI